VNTCSGSIAAYLYSKWGRYKVEGGEDITLMAREERGTKTPKKLTTKYWSIIWMINKPNYRYFLNYNAASNFYEARCPNRGAKIFYDGKVGDKIIKQQGSPQEMEALFYWFK